MPELSLRPTLETDLQAAYQRNVDTGLVTPDTTKGLGEVAADAALAGRQRRQQGQRESEERFAGLSPEVWMEEEVEEAAAKFDRYNGVFRNGDFGSPDIDEVLNQNDFEYTVTRLHSTKEALYESGLENPDGEKISDSMKIVLMPWQAFRNNLDNLPKALLQLRKQQAIHVPDEIDPKIIRAINEEEAIYSSIMTDGRRISPRRYLDRMIDSYGAWGVALIQTSNVAGVKDLIGKSPDSLTDGGARPLHLGAAKHLSSMGIFEWLALTLQEDPEALSSHDSSWMLANRFYTSGGRDFLPEGKWDINGVRSGLNWGYNDEENTRPRLTRL